MTFVTALVCMDNYASGSKHHNFQFRKIYNSNGQHSLLETNTLNDSKIEQTWNKWWTYALHWEFCENILKGSLIIIEENIFAIEPPLWDEGRVLYDGAKMTPNMAEPLSNAMM